MQIINRYICLEFLKGFGFILASLTSLSLIIDIVGRIRMFLSHNASLEQIVSYHAWQLPFFATMMIPASALLAALLIFTTMSKNNEIIALKAGGVSVFSVVKPLILLAALLASINIVLNGFLVPYALAKAQHIIYGEVQKRREVFTFKQNEIWYKDGAIIYKFDFYDPQQEAIKGVEAFYFDNDFKIIEHLRAPTAFWHNGAWEVQEATVVKVPSGDFPRFDRGKGYTLPLKEKPTDFVVLQRNTATMDSLQILRYAKKIRRSGDKAFSYLTEFHSRLAFPFVSVLLVIIGAAFSIKFGREGGMAGSIGAGLALGFSYWILDAFAVSLGKSGLLLPMVAAWSANIAFGALALFLLLRIRT